MDELTDKDKRIKISTMQQVDKYNNWVKKVQKKYAIWRPKPPRQNTKEPFKYSNFYLATSRKQIEKYPVLKNSLGGVLEENVKE